MCIFSSIFIFNNSAQASLTQVQIDFQNSGQSSNIISNEYFLDTNSMTTGQIQDFLNANNSYLKGYADNSEFGMGRSAAQIIYDAAHGKYQSAGTLNGITINETTGTVNPKLILVYLQKEQSLISRTTYSEWAMTASMGYFCYTNFGTDNPTKDLDHNNCHDSYQGFTRQVENGAWQLRYNYERAQGYGFSDYQVGQALTTEDNLNITLSTRATSAVYRYTPYVYFSAYNVWNLFYNIYDFDQGGGVPAPQEPPSDNDTVTMNIKLYTDSYSYTGVKIPTCQAFYGDTLVGDLNSLTWTVNFPVSVGQNNFTISFKDADGTAHGNKDFSIIRNKMGDATGDNVIDLLDLSMLASKWGTNDSDCDFNKDGTVDLLDLSVLADNWGK